MDDKTKGYLEGLQAAALICQENAGDRNSHLSDKIMALHSRKVLEGEVKNKANGNYLNNHNNSIKQQWNERIIRGLNG